MKTITAAQLKAFADKLELDDTIQISRGTGGDELFSAISLLTLSPTEENAEEDAEEDEHSIPHADPSPVTDQYKEQLQDRAARVATTGRKEY